MSKMILDRVQSAMEELTRVQFALRRELGGRTVLSAESIYKHLVNAQDEVETARIEMSRRMTRQFIQPQEVAD
jgi:hypothetical protein